MFPTLASSLGMVHNNPDRTAGRTGNRHAGLAVSPYNVYACRDGWFAIICNNDDHWRALLRAMGRQDLDGDPRFSTNAARVAHMAETDAVVEGWAAALTRAEIFAATGEHKIPSAPGRISVPGSPLRYQGTPPTAAIPSPSLGADNATVYGELAGLGADEVATLLSDGVI
jgi:CoA:oxalate CoA-transferase